MTANLLALQWRCKTWFSKPGPNTWAIDVQLETTRQRQKEVWNDFLAAQDSQFSGVIALPFRKVLLL